MVVAGGEGVAEETLVLLFSVLLAVGFSPQGFLLDLEAVAVVVVAAAAEEEADPCSSVIIKKAEKSRQNKRVK